MTLDRSLGRDLKIAFKRRGTTPCPGEGSLLAFYRGELEEAGGEAIREHLAGCASCVDLARDAHGFVEAMGGPAVEVRPLPRVARWLAAAAALLVAAVAGLWMTRQRPAAPAPVAPEAAASRPSNPWRDLRVAAAAYRTAAPEDELIFRSGDEPRGGEFAEAMVPYARADYGLAEASLARFLEAYPGHADASFYRGVSLLMLGRPEQARSLLASAVASKRAPQEARWYLALALLKSGDAAAALPELAAVAAAPGPHRKDAEKLSGEVRGVLEGR